MYINISPCRIDGDGDGKKALSYWGNLAGDGSPLQELEYSLLLLLPGWLHLPYMSFCYLVPVKVICQRHCVALTFLWMVRAGGFGADRRGPARRLAVARRRDPPQRSRRAAEATPLTPDPLQSRQISSGAIPDCLKGSTMKLLFMLPLVADNQDAGQRRSHGRQATLHGW